jgi:hypothetical protein
LSVPRWGLRASLVLALFAYAWLMVQAQAPLLDSCEPCDEATVRWLARNYAAGTYYLAFAAALLLPIMAIAGALATILSRRFAGRPVLVFLTCLLVLAVVDLKLLAYW